MATGSFPKYRQLGNDDLVRFHDQYFCIKVNEAKVFDNLMDGGDCLVWIEANWGGVIKKTRNFKKPMVN